MEQLTENFKAHAIVELMGHQRIAGYVQEMQLGGHSLLRVDVPETETVPAFTRIFNPSALYAINPCTEDLALMAAKSIKSKPIMEFDMQRMISKMVDVEVERRTALPSADIEDESAFEDFEDSDY